MVTRRNVGQPPLAYKRPTENDETYLVALTDAPDQTILLTDEDDPMDLD